MITIFFLGIFAGIVSPLLRVRTKLGIVLAGGAAALTIFAAAGLMTADPREGLAAIEANRKEYLFVLACEVPVPILALVSLKRAKWVFWTGWGIHAAFTACVIAVVILLNFFWHW